MKLSTVLRRFIGINNNNIPIEVKKNSKQPPKLIGKPGFHTTLSGKTIVYHPNAYKWPTKYHHSTQKIIVGSGWITELLKK